MRIDSDSYIIKILKSYDKMFGDSACLCYEISDFFITVKGFFNNGFVFVAYIQFFIKG